MSRSLQKGLSRRKEAIRSQARLVQGSDIETSQKIQGEEGEREPGVAVQL